MDNIIVEENTDIIRRQILVVQIAHFVKWDEKNAIREDILQQMKSGLVILPCGYSAIVCDADTVMIRQKEGE